MIDHKIGAKLGFGAMAFALIASQWYFATDRSVNDLAIIHHTALLDPSAHIQINEE